jgi:hypothetical protein
MRLSQVRYAKIGRTVLGFISIDGEPTILTLEDYHEMVDAGFYHLVHFTGVKFRETYALIGSNVSVYPEPSVDRSTCVYHAGDTHEDTTGCPLVGVRFHFDGSTPNIDGGKDALNILRKVLNGEHYNYVNITEEFWNA